MSNVQTNETNGVATGFVLRAGALRAAVRPDLGGSLSGLWYDDVSVLRSCEPEQLEGSRRSACFPLLPYSNRLGFCQFSWKGRTWSTQPNFDNSPHSLHGVGWQNPWEVTDSSLNRLTMCLRHAPNAHWPFAFEAVQHLLLTGNSLRMGLQFTNTDALEQPVGLGWHPYFPKRESSRLRIDVQTRWEMDALQLPTHEVPQEGVHGLVSGLSVDHCFGGWKEPAIIEDEYFSLRLSASTPWLVVFTPPAHAHFCVEPVSHINNAIQAPDPELRGLNTVSPGQTLQAWMQLDIEKAIR